MYAPQLIKYKAPRLIQSPTNALARLPIQGRGHTRACVYDCDYNASL
jgi:hypothetical protein